MTNIVITGSTRGIGFALARAFAARGCNVSISGRKPESTAAAAEALRKDYPQSQAIGFVCDVSDPKALEALWEQANKSMGSIDIWINNAGISNRQSPPWDLPADEVRCVVETNILGEVIGSAVAMRGFLKQGHGALYNVEGMGADGKVNRVMGLSIYGMTKAGLHYFNKCLAQEVAQSGIITGALQPGMVLTEMVTGQYTGKPEEWDKVKGVLGVIANPVDEVAAWMADKILTNRKNGAYFRYGGMRRILRRMLASWLQGKK